MVNMQSVLTILALIVAGAPIALLGILGLSALVGRRLSERTTSGIVQLAIFAGLFAALSILAIMLVNGERHIPIDVGNWVVVPHYHFSLKLVFDRL